MVQLFMTMGSRGWWECYVLFLLLLVPHMASSGSIIRSLPGYPGELPFKLETGYIGVGEDEEVQLFYYFIESERNPARDPVLIYFTGGPGCSALTPFFYGNGPMSFDYTGSSGSFPKLILNPHSWAKVSNLILPDMPVGAGFSYSETQQGYHSSDNLWVEHAYSFLQKWLIDHPEFGSNPLYIGGTSYAGIPVPPVVQKVYEGFLARQEPLMNIQVQTDAQTSALIYRNCGYVLSSPKTDWYLDNNTKVQYAHQLSLISPELYESIKASCNGDYVNIDSNNTKCVSDYEAFSELIQSLDPYNILEPMCVSGSENSQGLLLPNSQTILHPLHYAPAFWCRAYNYALGELWANDPTVREALHVREGTKGLYKRCNWTIDYTKDIPSVIECHQNLTNTDLRSIIYCGDMDMSIPHISAQTWIHSLNLDTSDLWRAWFVDGQVAGYTEKYQKNDLYYLTYVSVKGAGHGAEEYRPKEVYHMIDRWFSYYLI